MGLLKANSRPVWCVFKWQYIRICVIGIFMDLGSVPGHLGADNTLSDEPSIQLYSRQMCKAESPHSSFGQKISEPNFSREILGNYIFRKAIYGWLFQEYRAQEHRLTLLPLGMNEGALIRFSRVACCLIFPELMSFTGHMCNVESDEKLPKTIVWCFTECVHGGHILTPRIH